MVLNVAPWWWCADMPQHQHRYHNTPVSTPFTRSSMFDVSQELLRMNADPNRRSHLEMHARVPLIVAAGQSCGRTVALLLTWGAFLNPNYRCSVTGLRLTPLQVAQAYEVCVTSAIVLYPVRLHTYTECATF